MPPLDLDDGKTIRTVIVEPVVEALRAEVLRILQPAMQRIHVLESQQRIGSVQIAGLGERVGGLEKYKMRVAAVCSTVAVLVGIAWRIVQDKITRLLTRKI